MSWAKVIIHELIHKNSDEFKADAVHRQIVLPFAAAGNVQQQHLFVAGFGNRPTDGKAYEKVGVPAKDIYIINSNSKIIRYDRDDSKGSPNIFKEAIGVSGLYVLVLSKYKHDRLPFFFSSFSVLFLLTLMVSHDMHCF